MVTSSHPHILCPLRCNIASTLQDSDQLWQLSPPARSALAVVLQEPSAALQLSWSIIRTAPLASGKGGPGCEGQINVMLAGETRMQLLEVRFEVLFRASHHGVCVLENQTTVPHMGWSVKGFLTLPSYSYVVDNWVAGLLH